MERDVCPKCGSSQIRASSWKAAVAAVKPKHVRVTCITCGHVIYDEKSSAQQGD